MKKLLLPLVLLIPSLGIADNLTVTGWIKGGGASGGTPGNSSISVGNGAWGGGVSSSAFGYNTWSYGHYSTTLGIQTRSCYNEVVIGKYNDYSATPAFNDNDWTPTDPLFTIGNGPSISDRRNAFRILKNGNLTGNGTDNRLPFQTTLPDGSSILTRALGDSRYFTNTNSQIILGENHIGNSSAAIIVGNGIPGTPANSLMISKTGDASLNGLTAAGAVSLGNTLSVTGQTTVAGFSASGNVTGTGTNNTLSNQQLTEAGSIVTRDLGDARYFNNNDPQIVIGNFEEPDSNAALIIGNGIDTNNRSNSFVVKKDGSIVVTGSQSDLSMGSFN